MFNPFKDQSMRRAWAAAIVAAWVAGCAPDPHADEALPDVGWHVDQITRRQVNQAAGDRLVIYEYE